MEKYKLRLQNRIRWMALLTIGIAVILIGFLTLRAYLPEVPSFIKGFQVGIFTGIELILVYYIVMYSISLKKEDALKKTYIEEHDERTVQILQYMGSLGMHVCLIGFGIAAIIAGFFSSTIFFTLLGVLLFTVTVKFVLLIYFSKTL